MTTTTDNQKDALRMIILLHERVDDWGNEVEFYQDELRFFAHLVDEYFVLLLQKENINEAKVIVGNIHHAERECKSLRSKLNDHEQDLADQIDQPSLRGHSTLLRAHELIKERRDDFVVDLAKTKRALFALSSKMMRSEKLKHLLNE